MPRREEPQIGLSQEALGHRADIHPTWGNVRRIATGLRVSLPVLAALAEDLEAKHGTAPQSENGGGRQ